ncbi:hypothetical protein [Cryptosporidium parvum Iowa II]|uniref:Uncharacterized protein n=2 Tax=Cryptosporidium parvum TaxID=5807 RepID=Q5CTI6_CRYPI|nr:hypothetical protein [Cryptosporidium parvum Iowa II]EAK88723.1 hypothetical protein, possible signal peptide [Cryptosporidium parvum Iowa II]QOY42945.1 Uncharacterized protein CPATCC_0027940 [Cryptosporidium parvum]WKS76583.1 signal peptide containing protein [Cryptosporidium sp. 43IA8]WRK31076.1 Uncharacterized protein cpbgf_2002860 [Cryptosporidium parvum]|eukprot:QOY42945.1 hypothetical protein CPATCC_000636 [Cryptosporidium parvum]
MKNNLFLIFILIGSVFTSIIKCSKKDIIAARSSTRKISDELNDLLASKAYFLVDPNYFWSLDATTQVETKAPLSESEFLVVNAPSIGIEELIFIKNRKKDGEIFYSHESNSFLTYTLECINIGKTGGWVLKQPSSEIAYGFAINNGNEESENCKRALMPYKLEKWYNSLNQQIKDMLVTQIWIS